MEKIKFEEKEFEKQGQEEIKIKPLNEVGEGAKEQRREERLEAVVGKAKPRKFPKKFLIVTGAVIVLVLITVFNTLSLVSAAKGTVNYLKTTLDSLKAQDLPGASEKLDQAKASLEKTSGIYKRFFLLRFVPFVSGFYKDGEHLMKAGKAGLEAGEILIDAIEPYSDVLGFKGKGSFTGGTAEDRIAKIVETLDKVTPKIDEIVGKLQILEEELAYIEPERYPEKLRGKKIKENVALLKKQGKQASKTLTEASPLIKALPEILGDKETEKYLVIFQNDGELRPTGGFMTAYAILGVEKGKIRAGKSDDIYTLDKKFGNKLPAPEPIKKYLPLVDYWHLRDMNLSPDFKESMETFYSYYKKVPDEEEVDGIVAIDTKVLKDLIEILGPVNVPGYGEFKIDLDERCNIPQVICELEHIVDRPLAHVVTTRKISILGPMMQEILFKAMGSPSNLWPQLARSFLNQMREKHILVYFPSQEWQKAVESFGAAGRVKDFEGDYLLVNDTNFGGAKSNLYVHYEVEQEIKVEETGEISETLTLTYTNPEPMDDCNLESQELCLNGILPNWLRVYVPKGSKLVEALGSEVEVTSYEELDKTVFEAFFKIRGGGGKAKMVFNYKLPFNYEKPYKLLIQKQPGKVLVKHKLVFNGKSEEFDLVADKEIERE